MCDAIIVIVPVETSEIKYFPSKSVEAPFCVPSITTLTPGKG